MYQVIGIKKALAWFALLCGAVLIVRVVGEPQSIPVSVIGWWKLVSATVAATGLVISVLGQSVVFTWICHIPLIRTWFPPLDGDWTATLESNWPIIQARANPGATLPALTSVSAKVKIVARLFHVRVNLVSADEYSISRTTLVGITRDPQDGSTALNYLYNNTTEKPKETDSSFHRGAASLRVEWENGAPRLEGVYWTDRNWHRGLNTAGKIILRRVGSESKSVAVQTAAG